MTQSKLKRGADACHQAYDNNKFTYWYVPTVTRDNTSTGTGLFAFLGRGFIQILGQIVL